MNSDRKEVLKLYPDATVRSSGRAGKRIIYSPMAGRVNADENPYLSEWHWTGTSAQRESDAWAEARARIRPPAPQRELPRRCYLDLYTPAELAIRKAMDAVEEMPADPRLTDAVVLLGQAKDKVADFVDGIQS